MGEEERRTIRIRTFWEKSEKKNQIKRKRSSYSSATRTWCFRATRGKKEPNYKDHFEFTTYLLQVLTFRKVFVVWFWFACKGIRVKTRFSFSLEEFRFVG